jgi:hypothetical protein
VPESTPRWIRSGVGGLEPDPRIAYLPSPDPTFFGRLQSAAAVEQGQKNDDPPDARTASVEAGSPVNVRDLASFDARATSLRRVASGMSDQG